MKTPFSYKNGNARITVDPSGTRITEFEGDRLLLNYPRQADVKLTNWCNMASICTYCHEKSNKSGTHADYDSLIKVLDQCGAGTEWAFGGGSTLHYPRIVDLLVHIKGKMQISNVTVNQLHLKQQLPLIQELISKDLIKGIGISLRNETYNAEQMKILGQYEHAVVHLIAGLNFVDDIQRLYDLYGFEKFLVLGYKTFGHGVSYYDKNKDSIEANKLRWFQEVHKYFGKLTISFDNLGIEQLRIRRWFSDSEWEKFYQGDDRGESGSMYIDAVNQTYSKTSRSPIDERVKFSDTTLINYFKSIHHGV